MPQTANIFDEAHAELSGVSKPKPPTTSPVGSTGNIFDQAHAELSGSGSGTNRPAPPPVSALSEFPSDATAGDIAKIQSRNVAIGALEPFSARDAGGNWKIPDALSVIPAAFRAAKDIATDKGTAKAQQLVRGAIEGPVAPIQKLISGDWQQAAEGAGGFLTTTVPAIEGLAKGAQGIAGAARSLGNLQAIRTRAIQSVLKPNKAAFDFGADPVKEVANLPPTSDIKGMQGAVRQAIKDHESQLQTAVNRPLAPGVNVTANVEPLVRAQANPILDQASRWGRKSTSSMVKRAIDSYLNDLKTRRGSTNLSPQELLEEKRFLNKEIKFNPNDTQAQNLNALKMGVYRALDTGLDILVPDASEINRRYSGLVEADHLLKQRALERGNADLTGETAFQTGVGMVPDIAVKTRTAAALKPRPPVKNAAPVTTAAATAIRPKTAEDYLQSKGAR